MAGDGGRPEASALPARPLRSPSPHTSRACSESPARPAAPSCRHEASGGLRAAAVVSGQSRLQAQEPVAPPVRAVGRPGGRGQGGSHLGPVFKGAACSSASGRRKRGVWLPGARWAGKGGAQGWGAPRGLTATWGVTGPGTQLSGDDGGGGSLGTVGGRPGPEQKTQAGCHSAVDTGAHRGDTWESLCPRE